MDEKGKKSRKEAHIPKLAKPRPTVGRVVKKKVTPRRGKFLVQKKGEGWATRTTCKREGGREDVGVFIELRKPTRVWMAILAQTNKVKKGISDKRRARSGHLD